MKNKNIVIFVIALLCLVVALYSMSGGIISPYVPFKTAQAKAGSQFQVIGSVLKEKEMAFRDGIFSFTLRDKEGTVMTVHYRGPRPLNFEHSEKAVVVGSYDRGGGVFMAEKLLVKCPSKYTTKVQ